MTSIFNLELNANIVHLSESLLELDKPLSKGPTTLVLKQVQCINFDSDTVYLFFSPEEICQWRHVSSLQTELPVSYFFSYRNTHTPKQPCSVYQEVYCWSNRALGM